MSRHHNYPVRVPRFAAGIRAQGGRVATRHMWWVRRWMSALESLRLGPRLGRGRSYALSGQVTSLVLQGPSVTAEILGSRPKPYRATMEFQSAKGDSYDRIVAALRAEPMLVARLLVDDMPMEVESIFAAEGIPLFPTGGYLKSGDKKLYDVTSDCSCPDYANPCKHLAAVYCLLGEEIARRPATLLSLRGVELDDLFDKEEESDSSHAASDLQFNIEIDSKAVPMESLISVANATALLTRLGPIPFWRSSEKCTDALGGIYRRVQSVAAAVVRGEPADLRNDEERVRVRGANFKLKERGLTLPS